MSRLDHDANIRPWVQAAARRGATVRWAEVDLATTELPAAQYGELLSERTRLVAVTAASNVVGTRPDLAAIAAAAHAVGALVYVDGVHATPHVPVDVEALGADFYATSAYKWSGPHIGTVVADPALLDNLHPDKLAPAPAGVPGRFERGTAAFADLAGVVAAVEHLASLGHGPDLVAATRRQRLLASMAAVEQYETALFAGLLDGLDAMEHVTLYGRAARGRRPRSSPWPARRPGRSPSTWPRARSTSGTATTTPGNWPARSGCGTPAVRSGPAWCTTTTRPTSTACWPRSRSLPDGVL